MHAPLAIDAEVNAQGEVVVEFEKQLLADCAGSSHCATRNQFCVLAKSALRRINEYWLANKETSEVVRVSMNGMTLRQLRDFSALLKVGNLRDSASVTLVVAERLGDENLDEFENLFTTVLSRPDSNHVCVVVLAGEFRS